MSLTTLTADELYKEISDLARDQGVAGQEAWDDLVEEAVEDHLDVGELDPDEDIEAMKKTLRQMWTSYRRATAEENMGQEEDFNASLLDDHADLGQTKDEEEMI